MHYGEGIMKEEIERARIRAEKASGRVGGGYEYASPLGQGFHYQEGMGGNPFRSTRRDNKKRYQSPNGLGGKDEEIEYEEGYFDVSSSNYSSSQTSSKRDLRGRDIVSERMTQRRKLRKRNRGDPLSGREGQDEPCAIM